MMCCCFTQVPDDSLGGQFCFSETGDDLPVFGTGSSTPGYTGCLCDRETGLLTHARRWKQRSCSEGDISCQPEFVSHSCPILWLLRHKLCLKLPVHLECLLPTQICWCLVQPSSLFPQWQHYFATFFTLCSDQLFLNNSVLPWRPLHFCHVC